jgi:membrane-associated phospholipid phosphatase
MVSLGRMDLADPHVVAIPKPAGLHHLRPVDVLLLGYVAVVSAVAAARTGALPDCIWLLAANGLIVVLILLVTRSELGRFGQAVRDIYPIVLVVALYASLDVLNGGGRIRVHDAQVQEWEAALFGGQPSRDWCRAEPSRVGSTVLHGAYFSYYLIIIAPTVALLARTDRAPLRRFVLAVMTTFVICYLCFIFFPVAGPYYAFPRPNAAFVDNPAARLVYAVLAGGSSYGAAFPSSHVAASLTATLVTWTVSRRLGIALALATGLLTVGVVYCQMHYAVDAITGLVVGGTVAVVVNSVNGKR